MIWGMSQWFKMANRHAVATTLPGEDRVVKRPSPRYKLGLGGSYVLFEEMPEEGFTIFKSLVSEGCKGLVVTRSYPEKLVLRHKLKDVEVFWLSRSKNVGSFSPTELGTILGEIKDFMQRNPKTVILLDGIEYLCVQNDFPRVLKFLSSLSDEVSLKKGRFIISVSPGTLNPEERALLAREFSELKG